MTERIVYTCDGKAIGTIEMTDRHYAQYVSDAHNGAMLFVDLMSYGLLYVASEIVDIDTTVYVR